MITLFTPTPNCRKDGWSVNKAEDVRQSCYKSTLVSFQATFVFACWRQVTRAKFCNEWTCSSGQLQIPSISLIKNVYLWWRGLGEQLPKVSKWRLRNTLWDQMLPALADGWRESCRFPHRFSSGFSYSQLVLEGDCGWQYVTPCCAWCHITAACRCMGFLVVSLELLREWVWVMPAVGSSVTKTGRRVERSLRQ